ncbi:MAG: GspE/PulE family protein [bacterium]
MNNKQLIDTLVSKGFLIDSVGQKLIAEASQTNHPVEDIILFRRLVDEVTIAKTKGDILGIPYIEVAADEISQDILDLVSAETVQTYKVAPLSKDGNMLVVGMIHPQDIRAQEALRFIAKQLRVTLGVYILTASNFELILRRYFPYESEIKAALKTIAIDGNGNTSFIHQMTALEDRSKTVEEEAPIIKIISSTLRAAVERGASDVHFEPQRTRSRVRFRLDGDLQETATFPIEIHQPLISRIKVLANLKIDETRIPQDGRFRTIIFGRDIDFRVSTFPTPAGEKAAVRVLDPAVGLKGIEHLGLIDTNAALVRAAIEKPFGMILVTGPTGSGKTTTLYALLQVLNKEEDNVLSLEDPVEYFIDGINQSQVNPEIGYTFASGLRQVLRQDPDVIMVGEIRDRETADLAIHAALTGHIVLSTLHTNTAVGVIPRLVDMGIESFLLPSALNLLVGQRLLRRLCDNCKVDEEASPEVQEVIKAEIDKMPQAVKEHIQQQFPYRVYHASGCEKCKQKGYSGRIAIFEALTLTPEIKQLITESFSEANISQMAQQQNMITLREDGIMKALQGIITIEEVLRETTET